jgi:hypothetical protein
MKTATKKKKNRKAKAAPIRFGPLDQQEQLSLGQVEACFEGWSMNRLARDLGEDFLVQIFDDGRVSGLHFYLQVKSTKGFDELKAKSAPTEISYPFKVKDLEHWLASAMPVILLVWDIDGRKGCWLDVPAAVDALEAESKKWRQQESATLRMPLRHGTDASGRRLLRNRVADLLLPVITKGKTLTIKPHFSFPDTPEGRTKFRELQTVVEEGGSVAISQANLTKFETSDWYRRLIGPDIPQSLTISSIPSEKRVPLQLVAASSDRFESVTLDMRMLKGGTKKATFSNAGQDSPFHVELDVPAATDEPGTANLGLRVSITHPCKTVSQTLVATRFLIAAKTGRLGVGAPNGNMFGEARVGPNEGRSLSELLIWEKALVKLTFIEARIQRFGRFDLSKGLSNKDLPSIERLHAVVTTGQTKQDMVVSFSVATQQELIKLDTTVRSDRQTTRGAAPFAVQVDPFGSEVLLGVKIPLGNVEIAWDDPSHAFGAIARAAQKTSGKPTVRIPASPVTCTYLDWGAEGEGPAEPLVQKLVASQPRRRKK